MIKHQVNIIIFTFVQNFQDFYSLKDYSFIIIMIVHINRYLILFNELIIMIGRIIEFVQSPKKLMTVHTCYTNMILVKNFFLDCTIKYTIAYLFQKVEL